jgi:hypothetical protein
MRSTTIPVLPTRLAVPVRRSGGRRRCERPQRGQQDHRHDEERRPAGERAAADAGHERRHQRAARERGEEEAERGDLPDTEDHRCDQPDDPGFHGCYFTDLRATGKLKYFSG